MNEQNNMTSEELEIYKAVIDEAYTAPKTDIHGAVMKQIRAERIMQKKLAQRKAFVKWGSIAAVVAIACLVGFKAIPEVENFAPMAKSDDARSFELAEDYDLTACGDANGYFVAEDVPGHYVVDDESVTTYGTSGNVGATTPYSAPTDAEKLEYAPEEVETEETEEAEETAVSEETVSE